MKTQVALLLIVAVSILSACKKNDPAPANAPAVNQPSTTAPSLVSGTNTSLTAHTGTGASSIGLVNLSDVVTDPQGDAWTITRVSSSNTSVATIEDVFEGGEYGFQYTGISVGTATLTIVVTDVNGNANTFTYSITVSQPPAVVNQPSTTAPSLASGTNTSLSVSVGSGNARTLNLSTVVSDPQGDAWSIESVSSSDITILGVAITSGNNQALEYTGNGGGNATITIVVKDINNNTNTLTYTVSVTNPPVAVEANAGPALNTGVNTSFSIQDGSNAVWDLSNKVTDAEGDTWTITTISTSNASIATATIESGAKSIDYVAKGPGTATLTLTLRDARNATSTVTVTINVYPKPVGPKAVEVK